MTATPDKEDQLDDLAKLGSLAVDQAFWLMVDTEPDQQLHALERLLAQHAA